MRRRALLAASQPSGGDTIFPISLIEGDNGEIGVTLFEYIIENQDPNSLYYFKGNEVIYVQGTKVQYAAVISDNMIGLDSEEFPGNILQVYLSNTGVLTIVYD